MRSWYSCQVGEASRHHRTVSLFSKAPPHSPHCSCSSPPVQYLGRARLSDPFAPSNFPPSTPNWPTPDITRVVKVLEIKDTSISSLDATHLSRFLVPWATLDRPSWHLDFVTRDTSPTILVINRYRSKALHVERQFISCTSYMDLPTT